MKRKQSPVLPVTHSDIALDDLHEITLWNLRTYGRAHTAKYMAFLARKMEAIGSSYEKARIVETRPDLRYMYLRRANRGYCHVAVFSVEEWEVEILHVFHSAQDWRTLL